MIELLATIVVLGILMGVAVPTVMSILNDSRNRTYVDDSIRMTATFDAELRKDNMMPIPAVGSCIMMNLTYIDNNTFNDAPYDGEYDRLLSFVVARRATLSEYKYYPRLVEKLPKGDSGYRGVNLTDSDKLYEKGAIDLYVKSLSRSNLFDVSAKKNDMAYLKAELNRYGISCNSIIVYAPNAEDDNIYN